MLGAAHDALADVAATIELAKLLRQSDAELFTTLFRQRSKRAVGALVNLEQLTPLVHVSGMFGGARHNLAVVAPVARHPRHPSEVICVDLARAPDFLALAPDRVRELLFAPQGELPEGVERPPIKTVRLNRAPVLLHANWVAGDTAERLGLQGEVHRRHLAALRERTSADPAKFVARFQDIWESGCLPIVATPMSCFTTGLSVTEIALRERVLSSSPEALATQAFPFEDLRLPELFFRFRARNFPDTLSEDETAQWHEHCREQIERGPFTLQQFEIELAEERADRGDQCELAALDKLERPG